MKLEKPTRMRTYGDLCGIARALDVIGERWALLVVRELLLGPKRFTDLRRGLPHIGPDVLSQRLRELERAGVLCRRTLAPPAGSRVYELTERGRELEPVLLALGKWGSAAPVPPGDPQLGVDSAIIALRTLFDAGAARELEATFGLRLGDQVFRARVARGELDLERGEASDADATISADPMTLGAVLWERVELAEAERAGAMTVEGDRQATRRFLQLFPLPEPATPA
jgi:DNA-binding HxlR family transcriptional regulator